MAERSSETTVYYLCIYPINQIISRSEKAKNKTSRCSSNTKQQLQHGAGQYTAGVDSRLAGAGSRARFQLDSAFKRGLWGLKQLVLDIDRAENRAGLCGANYWCLVVSILKKRIFLGKPRKSNNKLYPIGDLGSPYLNNQYIRKLLLLVLLLLPLPLLLLLLLLLKTFVPVNLSFHIYLILHFIILDRQK